MTSNTTQQKLEEKIASLQSELELLAPHPDRPDYTGPLFVDSALPEPVFERVLASAFAFANGTINDEIAPLPRPANSNFAIGQKNVISPLFHQHAMHEKMMAAYMRDLPRRIGLERWLAHYQRKLYALLKNGQVAAFTLAA